MWCWRRLLRVPWTARRSNQLILKEISPEYSLEGLMLKLKLQFFGHLVRRADSFEKTLMLGKIECGRRRGRQRMRRLNGITDSMDMSLSKLGSWWWTGRPGVLQSKGLQSVRHDWTIELNWNQMFRKEPQHSWFTWQISISRCSMASNCAPMYFTFFLPLVLHPLTIEKELAHPILFHPYT